VANHWTLGRIEPRSVVLDLGCGVDVMGSELAQLGVRQCQG